MQVQWRRSKVLEYLSEGYNQVEIANQLHVDQPTISRDVYFLNKQAQNDLQKHIHETVPTEYQKCMIGMKRNLKQTLEIAETTLDPKVKLQARAIANDCYKYIMDLTTNGAVITDAMKYVIQKTEQVNTLQKLDERIETIEDETTTNGVF
jgi:DNA-binding transcriptional regulator LsrR (DeoR family)